MSEAKPKYECSRSGLRVSVLLQTDSDEELEEFLIAQLANLIGTETVQGEDNSRGMHTEITTPESTALTTPPSCRSLRRKIDSHPGQQPR